MVSEGERNGFLGIKEITLQRKGMDS